MEMTTSFATELNKEKAYEKRILRRNKVAEERILYKRKTSICRVCQGDQQIFLAIFGIVLVAVKACALEEYTLHKCMMVKHEV